MVSGVPVTVRRSRNNKHLRLSVRGSRVTLSAPKRTPKSVIRGFAQSKSSWIRKHYVAQRPIEHGDYLGVINVQFDTASPTHFSWQEDKLILIESARHKKKPLHEIIESAMRERTLERADAYLPSLVKLMDVDFSKLRIARTVSRWGSCSTSGTLSLSLYAAKLPDELFKYLLIHELSHIRHPNHSPEFWNFVARWEPSYRELRKNLSTYTLDINPTR